MNLKEFLYVYVYMYTYIYIYIYIYNELVAKYNLHNTILNKFFMKTINRKKAPQ
jgi:hypothetical protein